MKRVLCICALVVVSAATAGCSFDIFEDIGSDPHPPTIEVVALVHYVAPVAPALTLAIMPAAGQVSSSHSGRSIVWNSGGFSLSEGQLFQINIAYSDAGGDIVKFRFRDLDGANSADFIPVEQTYFSGTSGVALGPTAGQGLSGIVGPHRLELWAEDSHDSRSEKVEFVITLVEPR